MRKFYPSNLLPIVLFFLFSSTATAQFVTGQIIRPCQNPVGRNILDPNLDNFASTTPAGFGTATPIPDIDNSEVPYKPLPSYTFEPSGDLRRGADHLFSDYVPDING